MKVIIKQISGSLSGSEQVFDLNDRDVLSIGRDPAAKLAFDPKDDIVSREHAVISLDANDPTYVALTDTKSRNGTFVIGRRVSGTVRLQPGDKIQLGAGGPEFSVDTDPRPAAGLAPTREQAQIPAPTREYDVVEPVTEASMTSSAPTQKVGVGKETFESTVVKLKSEGKKGVATAIGVGVVAVSLVASVLLYQNSLTKNDVAKTKAQLNQTNAALGDAQRKLASADMSAADVKAKIGKAIVYVECTFGLQDKSSGRPVLTTTYQDVDGTDLFVFMKTDDPKNPFVPLLLTDASQLPAGAQGQTLGSGASGSGFAVSGNGFILTNRHVVEPWVAPLQWPVRGVAFDPYTGELILDPTTGGFVGDYGQALKATGWNPTQYQGYQSSSKVRFLNTVVDLPVVTGKRLGLQVTLSGNSNPFNAEVARISDDHDVALIRLDSPEQLQTVDINDNYDTIDVGKVWVLGFPGASVPSFVVKQSQAKYFGETGTAHMFADPDTATGQLTRVIRPKTERSSKPMGKDIVNPAFGDVYELSVPGVGHGNSGGPVTDAQGKVIGILTLGLDAGPTLQYAVPIRYGKELISNN